MIVLLSLKNISFTDGRSSIGLLQIEKNQQSFYPQKSVNKSTLARSPFTGVYSKKTFDRLSTYRRPITDLL